MSIPDDCGECPHCGEQYYCYPKCGCDERKCKARLKQFKREQSK